MMQNHPGKRNYPRLFFIFKNHHFVNRAPIPQAASAPAAQTTGKKIAVAFQLFILIIPLDQVAQIKPVAIGAGQKRRQFPKVLIQPFIGIDGQIPFAGAAFHDRIPGGGEIVDPRKINQKVGVLFRNPPAAVGGAGVRHDQFAGDGLP